MYIPHKRSIVWLQQQKKRRVLLGLIVQNQHLHQVKQAKEPLVHVNVLQQVLPLKNVLQQEDMAQQHVKQSLHHPEAGLLKELKDTLQEAHHYVQVADLLTEGLHRNVVYLLAQAIDLHVVVEHLLEADHLHAEAYLLDQHTEHLVLDHLKDLDLCLEAEPLQIVNMGHQPKMLFVAKCIK